MRNLFIGLSAVALVAIAAPIEAQAAKHTANQANINPFQLVSLAENGAFANIPSYDDLATAVRSGKVDGEDVVKAAIATNRLPEAILNDAGYIAAVESQLDALKVGGE